MWRKFRLCFLRLEENEGREVSVLDCELSICTRTSREEDQNVHRSKVKMTKKKKTDKDKPTIKQKRDRLKNVRESLKYK